MVFLCIYAKQILIDFKPDPLYYKTIDGYEVFIVIYVVGVVVEEILQVGGKVYILLTPTNCGAWRKGTVAQWIECLPCGFNSHTCHWVGTLEKLLA